MSTKSNAAVLSSKLVWGLPLGSTLRELTAPATDIDGRVWPSGQRFEPLGAGYDGARGRNYQVVVMDRTGEKVRFLAAPAVRRDYRGTPIAAR